MFLHVCNSTPHSRFKENGRKHYFLRNPTKTHFNIRSGHNKYEILVIRDLQMKTSDFFLKRGAWLVWPTCSDNIFCSSRPLLTILWTILLVLQCRERGDPEHFYKFYKFRIVSAEPKCERMRTYTCEP